MHKMCAVEYQPEPINVAVVQNIEKASAENKLLITTKESHRFKGKVTFGQFIYLHPGSAPEWPPSAELQRVDGVGLKVAAIPSQREFIVSNPVKRLRQAQLETMCLKLCQELKSGVLQFRSA